MPKFLAVNLALILAASSISGQTPRQNKVVPLTSAAKLARAKALFKTGSAPQAISSSFSLTVSRPHIPNRGSLEFIGVERISPRYADGGEAMIVNGHKTGTGGDPYVEVYFHCEVNKRYLITYYISTSTAQTLKLWTLNQPDQTQNVDVGTSEVMVAVKAGHTGAYMVRLKSAQGLSFRQADVDKLD